MSAWRWHVGQWKEDHRNDHVAQGQAVSRLKWLKAWGPKSSMTEGKTVDTEILFRSFEGLTSSKFLMMSKCIYEIKYVSYINLLLWVVFVEAGKVVLYFILVFYCLYSLARQIGIKKSTFVVFSSLIYYSCANSDFLNEILKLLLPAGYFLRLAGLFTKSTGNLGHMGHTCTVSETELELHSATNQPQRPTPE